uniref:Uncharacterized protein n=1 Tax=Arundo donax TaxID=35708 RepID=A0A0A9D8H0_ARUDO
MMDMVYNTPSYLSVNFLQQMLSVQTNLECQIFISFESGRQEHLHRDDGTNDKLIGRKKGYKIF